MVTNTIDYIDGYIVGESVELNPDIVGDALVYEVDTNEMVEVFKQQYKINKTSKLKIEIEKIE